MQLYGINADVLKISYFQRWKAQEGRHVFEQATTCTNAVNDYRPLWIDDVLKWAYWSGWSHLVSQTLDICCECYVRCMAACGWWRGLWEPEEDL